MSDDAGTRLRLLEEQVALLVAQVNLMDAHVENLIVRVYELENPSEVPQCTCGYGGFHEERKDTCALNVWRRTFRA